MLINVNKMFDLLKRMEIIMKKGICCNKRNAIIITVVLSLLISTMINAKSWYALLDDGSVNKEVTVECDENYDEDVVDDYVVYDEDYNIVDTESTLGNVASLGGLGYDIKGSTLESELEDRELQTVATVKRKSRKVNGTQLKYLACLINAEAKGEPYKGKLAVGNVVINRWLSKKYPNTIQKVITQKSQFGPARNGALNRELRNYSKGVYNTNAAAKSSLKAAKQALDGYNNVGKRYFFNGKRYSKARRNNIIIGNHRFW